jgi:hypothetical protein
LYTRVNHLGDVVSFYMPSVLKKPNKQAQVISSKSAVSSSVANSKSILSVFEKFQKERLHFVQTVADVASREGNIHILQQAGVMHLLKPLLGDPVPAIQQAAAVALGRLANFNADMATAVVSGEILPQLIYSLNEQNVTDNCI